MLESMTGYGRGTSKNANYGIVLELKSVNSKYLEVRSRLPKEFNNMESKISAFVKTRFKRGYIDVYINLEEKKQKNKNLMIDMEKAKELCNQARNMQKRLKLSGDLDINTVLKFKDILSQNDKTVLKPDFSLLQKALKDACQKLKDMRLKEGKHLERDMKKRMSIVDESIQKIDRTKDALVKSIIPRLKQRVSEISKGVKFDEGRLEQEIVLYAAKADISEEITRVKSHLKKMNDIIKGKGACGRNLDFIIQEMNREINTIGSKSQASSISNIVVDLKGEIEKIREQVQNVE